MEKIPVRNENLKWTVDENGLVTIEMENKGIANKIAQKLIRKPKVSYIHLDETGSFIWPLIDGETDIIEIGKKVHEHFGEKTEPLYERLVQYFRILKDNGFAKL